MDRTPVAAHLQPFLSRYRRLWISVDDLDEAQSAIETIRRLNLRRGSLKNKANPHLVALTTALIVAYSRPFVHSRGSSLEAARSVPGSLLRKLSPDERISHESIIVLRNIQVAHSDADLLKVHLKLLPEGEFGISRVPREPFTRAQLNMVERLIKKHQRAISAECSELRKMLPHGYYI